MGTQCEKDIPYDPPKQWFAEKVTITPAQKAYTIGDTVWLSFATPDKTLFDTVSNQRLPSNSVKFAFGATLLAKYDAPDNPADGYCTFILPPNVSARYYTAKGGTTTSFYLGCDNALNYNVKIGIVFKYKGYYVFDMGTRSSLEPCANQTNPYPFSSILFTFDAAGTNKDVYLAIPESYRNEFPVGFTERGLDLKVVYAFKVQ
jgi:hypothetical protein